MKHDDKLRSTEAIFKQLDQDVQNITSELLELAHDDYAWWEENLPPLVGQQLDTIKDHLLIHNDVTFDDFNFEQSAKPRLMISEPLEGLIWLAALCQLDRIFIGVLPRAFVERYDLEWRRLALHWLN